MPTYKEKVPLTKREKLRKSPQVIAYDDRCLNMSYMFSDFLDLNILAMEKRSIAYFESTKDKVW